MRHQKIQQKISGTIQQTIARRCLVISAIVLAAQVAFAAPPTALPVKGAKPAPGTKPAKPAPNGKTAAVAPAHKPQPAARTAASTPANKALPVNSRPLSPTARMYPETSSWLTQVQNSAHTLHATDASSAATGAPPFADSLAVAFENYYLIVPWRFVADAWALRENTRFLVDAGPNPYEAHVVDIDLAGGVALLKTDQPVAGSISREQLRLDYPSSDESFFTLASRDWLRQGARFLKAKADASAVRYQIALGNWDMTNTRYIFDRTGKLVAINDNHAENEGWSGAAKSVLDLLRRQEKPRPASVSTNEQARGQIYFWQDRWTQALTAEHTALSFKSLDCEAKLRSINDPKLVVSIRSTHSMVCQTRMPLELGMGYTAGLKIWSGDVTFNTALDQDSGLATGVERALADEAFAGLDQQAALINLVTAPQCDQMSVTNSHGERNRVRFCTSALKSEAGLGDTALSIVSMPEGSGGTKMKYVITRMRGFDEAHSRRILEAMVENVRSLP